MQWLKGRAEPPPLAGSILISLGVHNGTWITPSNAAVETSPSIVKGGEAGPKGPGMSRVKTRDWCWIRAGRGLWPRR